jgi:tetratricopeptide (TPR) repeat protein
MPHRPGDVVAANNLAPRGRPPCRPETRRLDILPYLVRLASTTARFDVAEVLIEELEASDQPGAQAYGLLFRADLAMARGGLENVEGLRSQSEQAVKTFAELGDERGMAVAEWSLGNTYWLECRAEAAIAAYTRVRELAKRAGDEALVNAMNTQLAVAAVLGPTPMSEALPNAEKRLAGAAGKPLVEAQAKRGLGRLLGQVGEFDRARALMEEGTNTMREAGLPPAMAGIQARGFVERLAGDYEAAADFLRQGAEQYRQQADRRYLSTAALNLVLVLLELGRIDEAEEWVEEAIAEMNPAIVDVAGATPCGGHIAALRGDHEQGVELASARSRRQRTDFFEIHANTYMELGHVLALAAGVTKQQPLRAGARGRTRQGRTAWRPRSRRASRALSARCRGRSPSGPPPVDVCAGLAELECPRRRRASGRRCPGGVVRGERGLLVSSLSSRWRRYHEP